MDSPHHAGAGAARKARAALGQHVPCGSDLQPTRTVIKAIVVREPEGLDMLRPESLPGQEVGPRDYSSGGPAALGS